jgi:hypothetical protein
MCSSACPPSGAAHQAHGTVHPSPPVPHDVHTRLIASSIQITAELDYHPHDLLQGRRLSRRRNVASKAASPWLVSFMRLYPVLARHKVFIAIHALRSCPTLIKIRVCLYRHSCAMSIRPQRIADRSQKVHCSRFMTDAPAILVMPSTPSARLKNAACLSG